MVNPYKDELRINGKIYKRINGKWTIYENKIKELEEKLNE